MCYLFSMGCLSQIIGQILGEQIALEGQTSKIIYAFSVLFMIIVFFEKYVLVDPDINNERVTTVVKDWDIDNE